MNITFQDLRIQSTSRQSQSGAQELKHLRTVHYRFYHQDRLVAFVELKTMNIANHVPEELAYLASCHDHLGESDWSLHTRLFDPIGGFNAGRIINSVERALQITEPDDVYYAGDDEKWDEDGLYDLDEDGIKELLQRNHLQNDSIYYHKLGLISLVLIDPGYRGQHLLTQIFRFLYRKHYDIGVFFIEAADLEISGYLKYILRNLGQRKFQGYSHGHTSALLERCLDCCTPLDTLQSIYKAQGYHLSAKPIDVANSVAMFIEPHKTHPELYPTQIRQTRRLKKAM